MKICLFPHPNTPQRFASLSCKFQNQIDIEICFPKENLREKKGDIFILEEEFPFVTERLLALEVPPIIVIAKDGISQKQVRYLPDFSKQFPKLLKEIKDRNPMLQLQEKHQRYFYNQKDILYLQNEHNITIQLRQGTKIVSKQSFQKLSNQLSEQLFFCVGENVFVNIEYVSRLTKEAVFLQNGQKFPIPPTEAERIQNAFFKTKYLGNLSP